ncbi:PIF1-like helicase [Hirsutella rhossiliensis]
MPRDIQPRPTPSAAATAAADTEGGRALAAARRAQRRLGLREKPARTKRNPASADSRGRRSFAAADEKFGRSAGHSATADMEGRRPFAADESSDAPRDIQALSTPTAAGRRLPQGGPSAVSASGKASAHRGKSGLCRRWRPPGLAAADEKFGLSIGSQHSPRAIQSRPASRAEIPATTPAAAGLLIGDKTAGEEEQKRNAILVAEDLASALRHLDEEFEAGERLANEQTWCAPVPRERQVRTVRKFYRAFHDAGTLPIATCTLCYRKRAKGLREMAWEGGRVVAGGVAGRAVPVRVPSLLPGGQAGGGLRRVRAMGRA